MFIQLSNIYSIFIIINLFSRIEYLIAKKDNYSSNNKNELTISNRIVGGYAVKISKLPFMVSMQWRHDSEHFCGGSYIRPTFVLTAAHCLCLRTPRGTWTVMNPWLFVVVGGSANLKFAPTWQVQNIYRFIPHQGFHFRTMINDIGLIQLVKPFHITNYVRFIKLPRARIDLRENHLCSTMGWGDTKMINAPKILREVWLPLMANEECEKYLGGELPMQQMCAGKKEGGVDACQGDSGGPLICDNIQVGIVSWGYGCAERHSPGVYTRVDRYLPWIYRAILRNYSSTTFYNHYLLLIIVIIIIISSSTFN
ncbi:GSCOCT00008791001.2-RA-CDS [Cotesia congregata]|uniref:limulus clotting factor C n=1 Tax=Cotesia congregata TaxID=51543 RepID=A0A8J2HMJ7_COTCN|nr:GSCOCT00008791001.2-RA-CDS [Cotesia congregata]CAG5104476.1 Trypsin-like [Cotesia congregata]